MKKILLFLVVAFVFFACTKSDNHPSGTQQVNGKLRYDNVLGGLGLYYATDSNKIMIFKNMFSNDSLEYEHYKLFVNLNTSFNYINNGDTGCFEGNPSLCGLPLVEIVEFKIR
jgi:hypothetical protein